MDAQVPYTKWGSTICPPYPRVPHSQIQPTANLGLVESLDVEPTDTQGQLHSLISAGICLRGDFVFGDFWHSVIFTSIATIAVCALVGIYFNLFLVQ